jgi:uncharacterized membrane protein SirB2
MFVFAKAVHITTIVTSISFFLLRAIWMIESSPQLQRRWARIAPHAIDTLLLASGVSLVMLTDSYPLPDWLIAKLSGVVVYIVLGSLALRRAPTPNLRLVSLVGALMAVCYVVMVAVTRSALLGVA